MIEFMIIGIFLFLLINWLFTPDLTKVSSIALNTKGIEPCPQHKWQYKKVKDPITREERELLYCTKCGNPPGMG